MSDFNLDFLDEDEKESLQTEKSVLTPSQDKALNLMLELPPIFLLKGYAGTGKTYLLKNFITEIKRQTDRNVVLTATTHKAVSVARGDSTIHSYLGLVMEREKDKLILKKSSKRDAELASYRDIVIVDESSMLNTEVLRYLLNAQSDYALTLIFVGDPFQLAPVGEANSPVWDLESAETYTLTEIVRQAADSPIIKLATLIREGNFSRKLLEKLSDGENLLCGSIKDAQNYFLTQIEDSYDNYYDIKTHIFPQIISYRNLVVNDLNTWARRQVLGVEKSQNIYLPGEKVYIRSALPNSLFRLEEVVRIDEIEAPTILQKPGLIPINILWMTVTGPNNKGKICVSITPRDAANFVANKNELARLCKIHKSNWREFWQYAESLIEIKHVYSMTAHRAQGSTFESVICNKTDISEDRLFYTSVTRAAKKLFIAL
jgi:hypothetical protein